MPDREAVGEWGVGMRKAGRLVVAGWPHHVIQRGLRAMNLFEDDRGTLRLLAYCRVDYFLATSPARR